MKTGPDKPRLSERLRQKTAEDNAVIEALIKTEREKLKLALTQSADDVVKDIEKSIRQTLAPTLAEMNVVSRRVKQWPIWALGTSLMIMILFYLGSWAVISLTNTKLANIEAETVKQQAALNKVQAHGLEIIEDQGGQPVLLLPPTARTDLKIEACLPDRKNPCIWLK